MLDTVLDGIGDPLRIDAQFGGVLGSPDQDGVRTRRPPRRGGLRTGHAQRGGGARGHRAADKGPDGDHRRTPDADGRRAHRVAFLDRGRIVEHGSHDELLRQGGRYDRFWALAMSPGPTPEEGCR
ncbi:hypothetical protein [Streptomyces rutgersensis]|uniref:hypothetical protein n=1 Tax=Streptomyces rutgersensis TaxID=53451 RepID=UPI00358DCE50